MAFNIDKASEDELATLARNIERFRALRAQQAFADDARSSKPQTWESAGCCWIYVVLDGAFCRITCCQTQLEDLCIPATIDGMPVLELGDECLARLQRTRRIVCPDSIVAIGRYAFRMCDQLEELVLPAELDEFDRQWVSRCRNLKSLVMPGKLASFDAGLFEECRLERIWLGASLRQIQPGSFAASRLSGIEVSPHNPHLHCDGQALYSKDLDELLVLAVPATRYAVAPECRRIAEKAFSSRDTLEQVELPNGLESIGDYAFFKCGLSAIDIPASTRHIGSHAFFRCKKLRQVSLQTGLRSIGDAAFAQTALSQLHLPASIESIGEGFAEGSPLRLEGDDAGPATLDIQPDACLMFDGHGGIYRKLGLRTPSASADGDDAASVAATPVDPHGGDGPYEFLRLIDPTLARYQVLGGTTRIAPRALFRRELLAQVELPDTLESIGAEAFASCRQLHQVVLPDTLESIGDAAFFETRIEALNIPARLHHIGRSALATYGAVHDTETPSLRTIEVDARNPWFELDGDVLIEQPDREHGGKAALLYLNNSKTVTLPDGTETIRAYAFASARKLRKLSIPDTVAHVETHGFDISCTVTRLIVRMQQPVAGHRVFELQYPDTDRSMRELRMSLNTPGGVDIERIFRCHDTALEHATDYSSGGSLSPELYTQSIGVLSRLEDPVFLDPVEKRVFEKMIEDDLERVLRSIARHDDKRAIDWLFDLGFIHAGNIVDVIEAVSSIKDASFTGYLLEIRRKLGQDGRTGQSLLDDFDL